MVLLSGDTGHLFAVERLVRRRCPEFSLGLSADLLHGYNATCHLTKPAAALVFSAVFHQLTQP
jgi:hypothetical protein